MYLFGGVTLPIDRVQLQDQVAEQVVHLMLVPDDEVDFARGQNQGDAFPCIKGRPFLVDRQVADHLLATQPESCSASTEDEALDVGELNTGA